MGDVAAVTSDNFDQEVVQSTLPVLVDFWAPWCGPCRAVAPVVEAMAKAFGDKLKVVKVNVDDSPQVATKYGIRSIPTLMIFKDGQPAETMVGYMGEDELKRRLETI
jgi:thioredoxin 1